MADLTAAEQLMLELINRARMDPAAEAKRFGIKLNEGVPDDKTITSDSKQVLAANDFLTDAARDHSKWMNDNDEFLHVADNKGPADRMKEAGYVFSENKSASGENIAARFQSGAIDNALAAKLIVQSYQDLFIDEGVEDRGHRTNILSDNFQEIGIGQNIGKFQDGSDNWDSSMVTQDFAMSSNKVFITGVVYEDGKVKNDDFFTVGEQNAGISVSSAGSSDTTGAGGGYELEYASGGERQIVFGSGGGVIVGLVLGTTNVKVDLVNGDEIWANTSIAGVSTNVKELHALGIDNIDLTGSVAADAIYGNKGRNTLSGLGGDDILDGDRGIDALQGGDGADTFVFAKSDTGKTLAKADVITDFVVADGDTIDLSAWDANTRKNGNQDFIFIDDQGFHKKAGELRAFTNGDGDTLVQGDTNGDGKADLAILLEGNIALTQASFDL